MISEQAIWGGIAVFVIGVVILAVLGGMREDEARAACEAKGGIYYHAKFEPPVCFKKEVFLK